MDTAKQPTIKTSPSQQIPPAQLWIGTPEQLVPTVHRLLKERFCPHQSCGLCQICRNLNEGQHHSVRWFAPDGWYKRDDLEDLFTTIALSLDEHQEYFFIIQKADCLPPACFNSLLKSIEEPPPGYYFILLAERINEVAVTIRSRCVIQQFGPTEKQQGIDNPLAALFLATSLPTPFSLLQALEQTEPDEQQTVALVDMLLAHWLQQQQKALLEENQKQIQRAEKYIAFLKNALEEPPMPGSSNLFWKNLFLQIHG